MRLLRIVPDNTRFRIVHWRRLAYPFSAAYSVLVLVLFLTVGLNFGIDFRGGTLMEMQAKSGKPDIAQVRQTANGFGFGEVEVQEFGNAGDLSMRFALQPGGEVAQQAVVTKARAAFADAYEFRRVETVGPRVSGELVQAGTLGVVLAIIGVLVYLWFRFEMQLAIGAIVGTMHDIVLTMGFFLITQLEFNLTSIAVSQAYMAGDRTKIIWECALQHAPGIIRRLLEEGIPDGILFNLNFPNVAPSEVAGVAVTAQGRRDQELMRLEARRDGRGNPYYWIAFQRSKHEPANGTDLRALAEHKISVTPLELDLTHEPTMTRFARVFA